MTNFSEHYTTVRGLVPSDRLLEWTSRDDRELLYQTLQQELAIEKRDSATLRIDDATKY